MGTVAHQLDRDLEIYKRWTRGERQTAIAQDLGLAQQTVSDSIKRAKAALPDTDRGLVLVQSVEMVDALLGRYFPQAANGDKGAARLVDRLLGRRADLLGLTNPRKLELFAAQEQIRSDPVDVPAELAKLMARVQARGDVA